MAVTPAEPIAFSDLQTLATLANKKLSPSTPFAFTPFAGVDQIGLPTNLTATPAYGTNPANFGPGGKITIWVYAYKNIGGVKTYSFDRVPLAFYAANNGQFYTVTFNWQSVIDDTVPDGYVVIFPVDNTVSNIPAWNYYWKDIGNVTTVTVSDPTWAGWKFDLSLIPAAQFTVADTGGTDVPCAHGTWTKTVQLIAAAVFAQCDVACGNYGNVTALGGSGSIQVFGIGALVSGPWCVAAGVAPLQCWFQRPVSFGGIGPQYTQCYRQIQFWYNQGDAPGGVSLSAQNQLLGYSIASAGGTFLLKLLSCSTGTITISHTGGSTIVTQAVVAGTTYDFSFAGAGTASIDVHFTTVAAPAPVPAVGLSGDTIQSVSIPDSYFEILTTDPTGNQVTTCGQLTITEAHSTPGVWVANTLPTRGIMPFIDQDLPNYSPSQFFPASSRRVPRNPALTGPELQNYQPVVDNMPALWPIYPTADFTPDDVAGQPFLGSPAWHASTFTKYPVTSQFQNQIPVYIGNLWIDATPFLQENTADVRAVCIAPGTTLYANPGSPPTLSSFAAMAPAGTWLSLAESVPGFQTGVTWYFGIYNPTTGAIENTTYIVILASAFRPQGTFFPTQGPDDDGLVGPLLEGTSYLFDTPNSTAQRPVPLFGQSIYAVTICRLPGADMSQDVTVTIGLPMDYGWDSAGTFMAIGSFTIPAGQPSVTASVFWPVLQGIPLEYESSDDVIIAASVNFQPMVHSHFSLVEETFTFGGEAQTVQMGYYDGTPFFDPPNSSVTPWQMLFFPTQGFIGSLSVLLPIPAALYNDLTAVLNLFP